MSSSQPNETHSPRKFPQDIGFFRRLQENDSAAWDELLGVYSALLRRDIIQSLLRRSLPVDWLDDVEQQTWLTVVRLIGNFVWENEHKFYNWFRSIATFHIKNLTRKLKKQYVSLEDIDEDIDDSGLSLDFFLYIHGLIEEGPETQLALRESFKIIHQAMEMLKPREREILLRRILYNESTQQMAKDYGVKPESISVILVRTKQAIREHVARLKQQVDREDEAL
jgi:RNA polymerase sigma factor (sigma-70 family)